MKAMLRKYILLALLAFLCARLGAQPQIRERTYVQTDKEIYLAGELVWLKMITTDEEGVPMTFSQIGYVELLDGSSSKAQGKLQLREGTGSGTLVIPAELPGGTYRLVGYTRYMRNESPDIFFEKTIGVVNPLSAEIARSEHHTEELFPASPVERPGTGQRIRLSTGSESLAPRERVGLRIDGIPADIHTLSVSVVRQGVAGELPASGLPDWREELSRLPSAPVSREYLAEYEGHIISARLTNGESNGFVDPRWLSAMLAFPGNDIQLFPGIVNQNGRIDFFTQRAEGYTEVATSLLGSNAAQYRLDLESPFLRNHTVKPAPLLDISRLDADEVRKRSVAMQVQYSFVNDSLSRFDYPAPLFFPQPGKRYLMEEYVRFGTLPEVFIEFVTFVRFTRIGNKRYISVAREETGFSNNQTLVLLDGIPVLDHELLYDYNPLLLHRIDVYYDRYQVGGRNYNGIVALYTENNRYPELTPDPATRIFQYESPQAPRLFFSPDYSSGSGGNRLPDYRTTLYWNPEIETGGESSVSVPFYTSDLTGRYRIVVEGLTDSGEVVCGTTDFSVR